MLQMGQTVLFSLTLLLALSLPGLADDAQKTVRQIEIKSHWGGLGTLQNVELLVRKEKGLFFLDGKRINEVLVEALVAALNEPAIVEPELENLGITPAWLKANAISATLKGAGNFAGAAPNQKELFINSFGNPVVIELVVAGMFKFMRSDDYPSVVVTITFDDGSKISAESHRWYEFMLPWKLTRHEETTYNANISRAVAALMPKKTTNRERLAGAGFNDALADAVMKYVENEWKLLDAENRASGALARIRGTYTIVAAEINQYHHPEYGVEWSGKQRRETNLHVSLRKASFPPNVVDALVLPYQDGRIEGVDNFLRSAEKYEALVFSIHWLQDYIREHPRVPIRISYVHDASFGDRALKVFADDMHAIGKDEVVRDLRALKSEIALLITGTTYAESYWLVFPDKHMMLWRYGGPSGLLKWAPENFPAGRCSAYHSVSGGCAGVVVSRDGALADPFLDREKSLEDCVSSGRQRTVAIGSDALFPVHRLGKGGFINRTGEVVIPLCLDAVGKFSEGLVRFKRDGRWGYIDESGAVVIAPQFSWAWDFSERLARVDKSGKIEINSDYEEVTGVAEADQGFRDGLAMIQVDGKKGFIDKSGHPVIAPQFSYAYHFSEGLAAVCAPDHERWGYIDRLGHWAIHPQFEWASLFSENLAPVNRTHDCGYIDRSGVLVLQPPVPKGETDCAVVWGHFSEGLSRWKIGDKYGYIDNSGKTIIQPRFDLTGDFSEGLAAVMVGEMWGYIDKTGRMVIQPRKLHHLDNFHNGLAYVVTLDDKHGYIDKSGKYVWEPTRQTKD